jgi:hypothetical protein
MPWINETEFYYSSKLLRQIAESYHHIYQGIVIKSWNETIDGQTVGCERRISNPWEIAECKADFDQALNSLGKGEWLKITGTQLSNYKSFGRLQKIIIADILGIPDEELMGLGFCNVPRLRGYAYHLMADRLNDIPHHGTKTQFVAKLKSDMV